MSKLQKPITVQPRQNTSTGVIEYSLQRSSMRSMPANCKQIAQGLQVCFAYVCKGSNILTFTFSDRFVDPSKSHQSKSTNRIRHVDYDGAIDFYLYIIVKKNALEDFRFRIPDRQIPKKVPPKKRHAGRVLNVDSNSIINFATIYI